MAEQTLTEKTNSLLTADFLGKLDRLELISKKIFRGKMKGERKSKKKGQSVEFADFRDYVAGDDLRFIDWKIMARLDRLFLKLFQEEEDLIVYLLLDNSKSMNFGSPNKFEYASKLAAAISYICLSKFDRFTFYSLSSKLDRPFGPVRGKRQAFRLFDHIAALEADGETSLLSAAKDFIKSNKRPGVLILISDFLSPEKIEDSLRPFTTLNLDMYAIQVLSPEELNPEYAGDLKLVDVETGVYTEVSITKPLLDLYKKNLEDLQNDIRTFCAKRGYGSLFVSTDSPFEEVILQSLRSGRLLK
ncbi:MAG: DUF58 domain-containing protein [Planctomycetes bacterium]|nr:DUF58 domain-containing protein [Planctomycetota bacterium]